jgi:putative chitinase
MQLTVEQFKKLFPRNKEAEIWVGALNSILPQYDIDTPKRVAAFLAQCGHESLGFTELSENLYYSANGLRIHFGKYFKTVDPLKYEKKPEKIANRVYANRMGNGNEASGDGWKYRGRGLIQLTGKSNYAAFSAAMKVDAVTTPDLVSISKKIALLSAIWFWNKNKLNALADKSSITAMSKKINGGVNGLEERIKLYNKAILILNT